MWQYVILLCISGASFKTFEVPTALLQVMSLFVRQLVILFRLHDTLVWVKVGQFHLCIFWVLHKKYWFLNVNSTEK